MRNQTQMSQEESNPEALRPQRSQPKAYFQWRQSEVRKKSASLRNQLFAKMNQVCRFLIQNPDYKLLASKLENITDLLSYKSTCTLIETIKSLDYHVKESVQDKEQDLNVAQQQMREGENEFEKIRHYQGQMQDKYQRIIAYIEESGEAFKNMKEQLEWLDAEESRKRQEVISAEIKRDSIETRRAQRLGCNWKKETSYMKEILQEKNEIEAYVARVNTVLYHLQQKLDELRQIKAEYDSAKQMNTATFIQNIGLYQQLKGMEGRKEELLEKKRMAVVSQEIDYAGLVAEDWSQTQHATHQLLFDVMKEINQKLDRAQLKEIEKIVQAAEDFYKNDGRRNFNPLEVEHLQHPNQ